MPAKKERNLTPDSPVTLLSGVSDARGEAFARLGIGTLSDLCRHYPRTYENRGTTVTTPQLYEAVWQEKYLAGSGNTVMVHVLNLRKKIEENPSSPKIIRTVWGKGYQID